MCKIELIVSGFFCGVILLTYIHVVIIHRRINKLLKGIDIASDEADEDICYINDNEKFFKEEKIERLRICREIFRILDRAIHLS